MGRSVKFRDFYKYLKKHGYTELVKGKTAHAKYVNPETGKHITVSMGNRVNRMIVRRTLKELGDPDYVKF